MGIITVRTPSDVAEHVERIEASTVSALRGIAAMSDPHQALKAIKFEQVGHHPVSGGALNFIEQVNQTFTYLVALRASRWLLERHPDAGGFRLAPGANMAQRLDVMSEEEDLVGAETFAAVRPGNNDKLRKDLAKLEADPSRHRYSFFYAPGFPPGRCPKLERGTGVEVHCVLL